jgi:20S proteasome alpha/beta subunit
MAIGSRSQSARTYLEKHLDKFMESDLEELIKHGLRALRDTLPNEVDLSTKVRKGNMNYYLSRFDHMSCWQGMQKS